MWCRTVSVSHSGVESGRRSALPEIGTLVTKEELDVEIIPQEETTTSGWIAWELIEKSAPESRPSSRAGRPPSRGGSRLEVRPASRAGSCLPDLPEDELRAWMKEEQEKKQREATRRREQMLRRKRIVLEVKNEEVAAIKEKKTEQEQEKLDRIKKELVEKQEAAKSRQEIGVIYVQGKAALHNKKVYARGQDALNERLLNELLEEAGVSRTPSPMPRAPPTPAPTKVNPESKESPPAPFKGNQLQYSPPSARKARRKVRKVRSDETSEDNSSENATLDTKSGKKEKKNANKLKEKEAKGSKSKKKSHKKEKREKVEGEEPRRRSVWQKIKSFFCLGTPRTQE